MDYDESNDPLTIITLERWLAAHESWGDIEMESCLATHVRQAVYAHNEWLPNYDDHRLDWPERN